MPVTVCSGKKGPYTLSFESAQNMFTFGKSHTNFMLAQGFSLPQIYTSFLYDSTQVECGFIAEGEVKIKCIVFFHLNDEVLTEGCSSHLILF
jgi:hypothetical protein